MATFSLQSLKMSTSLTNISIKLVVLNRLHLIQKKKNIPRRLQMLFESF